MAFCSNCGTHSEDNEHFCKNCGHELSAAAAPAVAAPVAAPVAQAAPPAAPPPPPPVAAFAAAAPPPAATGPAFVPPPTPPPYPQPYGAPGVIPMAPQVQKAGMSTPVKVLVGIVGLVAIWYGLKQMGVIGGTTPSGGGTGGGTGGPNSIGTLSTQATGVAQQQSFTGQWAVANGDMQLNKGAWNNQSNVAVQSVAMECDQYDNNNNDAAQKQITLETSNSTPLPPQTTEEFNSIDIGPAVQNVAKVNCGILSAATQ